MTKATLRVPATPPTCVGAVHMKRLLSAKAECASYNRNQPGRDNLGLEIRLNRAAVVR